MTDEEREQRKAVIAELAKKAFRILQHDPPTKVRFYTRVGSTEPDWMANELVRDQTSQFELTHPAVVALGQLYRSLKDTERNELIGMLGFQMRRDTGAPIYRFSPQIFVAMARFFDFGRALETALAYLKLDETGYYTLLAIFDYIAHDHTRLTTEQLEKAQTKLFETHGALQNVNFERARPASGGPLFMPPSEEIIQYGRCVSTFSQLRKQVEEVLYRRLIGELSHEENVDIDRDRVELARELHRFQFPPTLAETLHNIEREFAKAISNFDFNTCVKHNRSFFEELLKQTALQVAASRGETPRAEWDGPSGSGLVRRYLKGNQFLYDSLLKLCEGFFSFASDEGPHKISSQREVARLVKNMNIELALLLLRRAETFFSKKPNP